MNRELLEVRGLTAALDTGEAILHGMDITIGAGETHVIMGPNGAGKSTLANVIMGHPGYYVTGGTVHFEGEDITEERADQRARRGIFLSFQSPEEVDGVTLENFLKTAKTAVTGAPLKAFAFRKDLASMMQTLEMDPSYAGRYLNVGFSGGEKKKSEILQMLALNPKLAILDETDSGLDVDAVKIVSKGIDQYKNDDNALMIISHSTRLLDGLHVDYVHILVDGRVATTGGRELIDEVNQNGFARFIGQAEPV